MATCQKLYSCIRLQGRDLPRQASNTAGKQVDPSVGVRETISKNPNVTFFSDQEKATLAVRP